MTERRIDDIQIEKRHRRELGDIGALAESIRNVGLLHPPVITPDGRLIAGERRLRACQALGWTSVLVTVVDMANVARGEAAENSIARISRHPRPSPSSERWNPT
jgi:ParB family chromosome partitioning protein